MTSNVLSNISSLKNKYIPLLDTKIANPLPLINYKNTSDKKTSDYLLREIVSEMNNLKTETDKDAQKFGIKINLPKQEYINDEFGKFSHTFRSVRQNTSEAATWYVIAICFLIDFIIPLAMYLLIRKKDNEDNTATINITNNRKSPRTF